MMMDTEGTRRDDEDPVGGDMESFGLTHEDTQDRDQWRLRIEEEPANPVLPVKWPLKWCALLRSMHDMQGWGRYFISVLRYKVKKYSEKVTKYK